MWYTYRMAKKRTGLKIPYGVSDFRTIRNEGLYYVDKTEYLVQMEAAALMANCELVGERKYA